MEPVDSPNVFKTFSNWELLQAFTCEKLQPLFPEQYYI